MILTIYTYRTEELARWIDQNLGETSYDSPTCPISTPRHTPGLPSYIEITFGGDDRILFDLRWRGKFDEIKYDLWDGDAQ